MCRSNRVIMELFKWSVRISKTKNLAMENLIMEKITDITEFDYYYSEKAFKEHGGRMIEGKLYVERIKKGKKPFLGKTYKDMALVHSGININLNSESI